MFTGIIESTGVIQEITKDKIVVKTPTLIKELKIGSSIATDGTCLTVIEKNGEMFTADVMPITFEKTVLGERSKGDLVNLELAMQHTDRFEGHVVSGHIEGVSELTNMKLVENAYYLTFSFVPELMKYIVPQGSIAINGISLTVAEVQNNEFSVSIIPHTWENTNLHELEKGDKVNIETDLMAKYAEKLMLSNE